MKKVFVLVAIVAMAGMVVSCGSTRNGVVASSTSSGNPFGDVYEVPAAEYDTDEYFGATGIASGPRARMDVLQSQAIANAQGLVRQKMQHAYQGMIEDYSSYIGNNVGADAETKMERGGTQIIDAIVNDTQVSKGPMFSSVDEKGNVTCYVGIRVSKAKLAEQISDFVSEDEELKIRFDEEQFRKRMDEAFKNYRENN